MGDADDSYDFSALDPFLAALRGGADLVMGDRFAGGIEEGAMPPLHRYVGNPALSFLGRLFFHSDIRDFHCGLRGFRRQAIIDLDLQSPGMEFASEMVVKATLGGLTRRPGAHPAAPGRSVAARPTCRAWRDGWRHLRFLLLYSPRWLFFYPGLALLLLGGAVRPVLTFTDVTIGPATFSIGTLAVCAGLVLIGYQSMWFALLSKSFASREGLLPDDRRVDAFRRRFPLELGLVLSAMAVVVGRGRPRRCRGGLGLPAPRSHPLDAGDPAVGHDPRPRPPDRAVQPAAQHPGAPFGSADGRRACRASSAARAWHERASTAGSGTCASASAVRSIPPGARVLDVGCHDGALFRALGHGLREGVGPGPSARPDRSRVTATGSSPASSRPTRPTSPGRFDAVTMLAVLEHVPPDEQPTLADRRVQAAAARAAGSS